MRVLVVEDEHKIAQAIKEGLEQESFAVDVAYNGDDGLNEIVHEDYDLVILDRMMPGILNGDGVLMEMRKQDIHTPVIMLTAKGTLRDRVEGLNNGADDYLVKPFAFEELLARMRSLLRRPKDAVDTVLKYETLLLNPTTFEVERDGKSIKLSTREFALLEYLMRNPDRILTKDMIMNHVWNYDADIVQNTVEVYIGYVRRKIDTPLDYLPPLLHTVRGFGYRLGSKDSKDV